MLDRSYSINIVVIFYAKFSDGFLTLKVVVVVLGKTYPLLVPFGAKVFVKT